MVRRITNQPITDVVLHHAITSGLETIFVAIRNAGYAPPESFDVDIRGLIQAEIEREVGCLTGRESQRLYMVRMIHHATNSNARRFPRLPPLPPYGCHTCRTARLRGGCRRRRIWWSAGTDMVCRTPSPTP